MLRLTWFVAAVLALFALSGCKTIPEGRSAVNDVEVRGANAVDDSDVVDKIATTESSKFLGVFRGVLYEYSLFDRFVLQRDLARVEAFYRSKGYYDAHARAGRIYKVDDKHVRVEIVVEEGTPVRVRNIVVDGLEGLPEEAALAARRAARESLPRDKPFDQEDYEKAQGNVRRALLDRGYAFATVKTTAAVDLVAHGADIGFVVTPGAECVFGAVKIEGVGQLPEAPIRRAADIDQGERYSQSALDSAQQAILDLGLFASVEMVPDLPKDPPPLGTKPAPVVPITIKVEPVRLRTVRLGGGVEFDALKTDVHGLVGWENRNFLGGMRTFSVEFRPGVVLYPVRVNNITAPTNLFPEERTRIELRQPGLFEARTNGFIRPEIDVYPVLLNPNPPPNQPVLGYGEIHNAIGADRTWWKLYAALSHNLQFDAPFSYLGAKDPTLGSLVISYPELFLSLDFRDDRVHPRKGIWIGNTLQVAGGPFFGDAQDVKVQPDVRGYVPITKRLTFAARGSLGFLEPRNYGNVVQRSQSVFDAESAERTRDYQLTFFRGFFSGGPTQNRGYPIRGVGPQQVVPFLSPEIETAKLQYACGDQCKSPTGGFTLWEASTELRFAIAGPLSVAAFCDASDVSPQTNNIRLKHLHLSCGPGARYDTPVGPVRLDVGYRIPGLQVIGGLTPDEVQPETFPFGIPIAVSIGIGEAY